MHNDFSTSDASRSVFVIYNPAAGARNDRRLERLTHELEMRGKKVVVYRTEKRGDAEQLASRITLQDSAILLVAGGDGTINEVINGLTPDSPPLAIAPFGTANVLAAEIGMPSSMADVAAAVCEGKITPAHFGETNGRRFIMMAGIGFDAHVVSAVSSALKKRIGKGAYVLESFRQLIRFPFLTYRVTIDGATFEVASAVIANGHFYAGRFICAPDASLLEPELHACLLEGQGRWNAIRYALNLTLGRLHRLADVRIVRCREITVDGVNSGPVQGDGEILTNLPVKVSVASEKIRLVFPSMPSRGT